jgi:hypothetical protein
MTCIVWTKNKLYADSHIYKDGEVLQSLCKIQQILKPIRIKSEKEGFVFDDIVHGWTGSGAFMPMVKFVESLERDSNAMEEKPEDHDATGVTVAFYKLATHHDLVVAMGNIFSIFLIGEKDNHCFSFETEGFSYKKYPKTETVCMGGARELVLNFLKAQDSSNPDVLRAMFQSFYQDHASGGFIDCWEMTEHEDDGKPVFRRYGLHHEIPRDLIPQILEQVYPNKKRIEPTFLRRELMYKPLLAIDSENQELTKKLAAANAKIKRLEKKLGNTPPVKKPAAKKAVKQAAPKEPIRLRIKPKQVSSNF